MTCDRSGRATDMMSREDAKAFAERWGVKHHDEFKSQPLAPITYIGLDDTPAEGVLVKIPDGGLSIMYDPVHHPLHYKQHPSGVECIDITEHMGFCLGNAVKYIWRADLKNDSIQDLEKAKWYIEREIAKRKAAPSS